MLSCRMTDQPRGGVGGEANNNMDLKRVTGPLLLCSSRLSEALPFREQRRCVAEGLPSQQEGSPHSSKKKQPVITWSVSET